MIDIIIIIIIIIINIIIIIIIWNVDVQKFNVETFAHEDWTLFQESATSLLR